MKSSTLYLLTIGIWGSTFFAIEFQLGSVPPILSVVYRYILASAILFAWCGWRGVRLRYPLRAHRWFALLGALLFGFNYVLAYSAQVYLSSALTAITFATVLGMNVVNARIFFGTPFSRETLMGAAFGIVGVILLFAPRVGAISLNDGIFLGTVLSIGGAFTASLGNMASQGAQRDKLGVVPANAWGMLYGAVFTTGLAALQGYTPTFDWSIPYLVSLLYLAIFGSIVAFGAYLTLVGRMGAERAGYALVAAPVIALLLSMLFEGLEVNATLILGVGLVLAGNLLVLRRRRIPEPRPSPAVAPRAASAAAAPAGLGLALDAAAPSPAWASRPSHPRQ